jgi:hypothetical protein
MKQTGYVNNVLCLYYMDSRPMGGGYISVTYYFYITWIVDSWEEVTSL